jgi:acyl-CoA synthetase (AMP-forming)/AMP-acid ligase II
VLDAVVFGMPDLRWGEALTAMVAVDDPDRMDPEELLRFVGERLAGYKKPRRIIVRHSLERGPTGKLNMRALRQDAADTVPGESNVRIQH